MKHLSINKNRHLSHLDTTYCLMWRLIYFIPIWIMFFILRTALILVGFITIPASLLFKAYSKRPSKYWPDRIGYHWDLPFMWIWGNEEDSILAGEEFKDKPDWFRILYWTAWRNPTNNWRFSWLGVRYSNKRLQFVLNHRASRKDLMNLKNSWIDYCREGDYRFLYDFEEGKSYDRFFYLCWQGLRSNFKVQVKVFGYLVSLWMGDAKLYPSAIMKIPEYQKYGVGPVGPSIRIKKVG